jgi:polyribonucleotide nucleotidyltransferase
MDFKVTGTREGITALQMDIKIKGLSADLLRRALQQAREGRMHILDKMFDAISEARPEISEYAPQLILKEIPVEKIGALIGPGGKVIRALQTDFGVKIEVSDEGIITIAGGPGSRLEEAVAQVEAICGDAEIGAVYTGKVVSIRDFGAFIEIFPGKEGLLHISDASHEFVKNIHDVFSVGDEAQVKVSNVDDMGRVRLCLPDVEVPEGGVGSTGGGGGGGRGARSDGPKVMPEVGKIYEGEVRSLKSYGAFVEVVPGTDGLCHVSEMADERVEHPEDVVSEGQVVKVIVLDIEDNGRIRLSMKQVPADGEVSTVTVPAGAGADSGDRPRRSGGGGGRGGRSGGGRGPRRD